MKTFLVAVFLTLVSATCLANPPPSHHRPVACENPPCDVKPPAEDVSDPADDIMKLLLGGDDKPAAPKPVIVCDTHPCVKPYRFVDEVNEDSRAKLVDFMQAAEAAKVDMVMVELTTPGGSLDEAHEISRAIENAPFQVVCVADGTVASAGMYILASCDTKVMTHRTQLMIHQVAIQASGGHRIGQVSVLNLNDSLRVATQAYIEWSCHNFKNITVDQVINNKISFGREWWLNWQDAIHFGAVDKVINQSPSKYLHQTLMKTGKP